jgi:hypothetical protein
LIKAAVLFRHGAREQQGSGFPPDPQAHSQLTTVGVRQLFVLGQFYGQKYIPALMPAQYNHSFLAASSTRTERTQQSLHSFMVGMFGTGQGVRLPDISADLYRPPWAEPG